MPTMREASLRVENRLGLHARAAAKLVQVLSGFQANATLCARGREINGKSIMGVMLLEAECGCTITIRATGDDAAAAAEALATLVQKGFDET